MLIRLAKSEDKEKWDEFVLQVPGSSFMQSWAWGEAQYRFGLKVWRPMVVRDEEIKMVALVVRRDMPLGKSWLYVPQGPACAKATAGKPDMSGWDELEGYLTELAAEESAVLIRIDPSIIETGKPAWLSSAWRKSEREIQPVHTLVVDIDEEEKMLAQMKQKTRYNIRLAEKKGVRVRFSEDEKDVKNFWQLAQEVQKRGKFRYHPRAYYEALWQELTPARMLELAVAEKDGEVLAVHWLVSWGSTVTYVHGASSSERRELMGAHLLQWRSIQRAKEQGYKKYDLFGVAPGDADKDHPWVGITRFKEGFGGRRVTYVGAYDMIVNEGMYGLFNVMRRARRLLR